jgi:hypothetical protein
MATRSVSRAAKAQSSEPTAALLAQVTAFHESPQGLAFAEADDALENGIAMVSVALRSLEADNGNEHEGAVLRAALERLAHAARQLDTGSSMAARAFQPAQETAAADAVRFPERVDVRLIACSPEDKAAILERLRNTPGWSAGDLDLEALVDDVAVEAVSQAIAMVPIGAAKALVRDLNAIGIDACIELTASSLRESGLEEARS